MFDGRIEGYYGEFKTQSASGAKTNNAVFLDVGDDFSFGFDANEEVLQRADVAENTDKSQVIQKLYFANSLFTDPWAARENPGRSVSDGRRMRALQAAEANPTATEATGGQTPAAQQAPKKLFNPVICLQEGDAVFFNVNSAKKQYPIYSKDSILNTNPDFDFGPFDVLADMINRQNITVTTYSHIFKD